MTLPLARETARRLMVLHGLATWRFAFDRSKKRFGICSYRQCLIRLSAPLTALNTDAEVTNTILHEIAHALTPGDGHGRRWQAMAQRIGARPDRCCSDDRAVVNRPKGQYVFKCTACSAEIDYHRMGKRLRTQLDKMYHTKCGKMGRLTPVSAAAQMGVQHG